MSNFSKAIFCFLHNMICNSLLLLWRFCTSAYSLFQYGNRNKLLTPKKPIQILSWVTNSVLAFKGMKCRLWLIDHDLLFEVCWSLDLMMNGAAIGPARPRICEKPRSCIETSTAKTSTIIKYHIPKDAEIANFPTKEIYRPIWNWDKEFGNFLKSKN